MQESSVNLPTLDGCTELILCATGFKFEYVGVKLFGCLLALTRWQSVCLEWSNSTPKKKIILVANIAIYLQAG